MSARFNEVPGQLLSARGTDDARPVTGQGRRCRCIVAPARCSGSFRTSCQGAVGRAAGPDYATPSTAASMSATTSSGCDTIATWLDGTPTVVAPIRSANERSASGGMASSFSATMYQVGNDFQAGVPITSPRVDAESGCCTANMTFACTSSTSDAKWLTKSSLGN